MHDLKHERGAKEDNDLNVKDLQELVKRFKAAVKAKKGKDFPDDPLEQTLHTGNRGVQADDAGLQDLLAREREELFRQLRRPLSGVLDLRNLLEERILLRDVLEREAAVPQNRGQQVVEVMCDPAREKADGFHLLRLPELFFQATLFGQIDQRALNLLSLGTRHESVVAQEPDGASILPASLDLEVR